VDVIAYTSYLCRPYKLGKERDAKGKYFIIHEKRIANFLGFGDLSIIYLALC